MWSRIDPSKMVAVLDWEMSTLGDPLTDLGMVSVYWGEAGALMWRSRSPQPGLQLTVVWYGLTGA